MASAELRDANGKLVEPLPTRRLDTNLAEQMPAQDLPHLPLGARHMNLAARLRNTIGLSANSPEVFWDFSAQDVYHIEKEGDFTFKVSVALYYLADGQTAKRMDLPPVTVRLHLTPSQK